MHRSEVEAVFMLADIQITGIKQIENGYYADNEHNAEIRKRFPWWQVMTSYGLITIGWRKRVILIDWSQTDRRGLVSDYDTTKSDTMIHAWKLGDAVNYLREFKSLPTVSTDYPGIDEFVFKEPAEFLRTLDVLGRINEGEQTFEEKLLIDFVVGLGSTPPAPFKATIERMTHPHNPNAPKQQRMIVTCGKLTIETPNFSS